MAIPTSRVYISFHSPITDITAQQLLAVAADQINKGANELYFLLSTPGGSVSSGVTLFNTLKSLPAKIIMHNTGNIDSIGNAIFLSGDERYACEHSTFMFHGVGFDVQPQRFERKDLEERLDGIRADEQRIGNIIAAETSLVSKDVDGLFVQAVTKNAEFALDKGIIHEIRPVEILQGSPILQLVPQR